MVLLAALPPGGGRGLGPRPAQAATLPSGFTESTVASGIPTPTAMALAPDGRIFVAEQGGRLRVIKNGALLPTPFLTVSVHAAGERGLLGVTFDPAFATNRFVYVYYTTASSPIPARPRQRKHTTESGLGATTSKAASPSTQARNTWARRTCSRMRAASPSRP